MTTEATAEQLEQEESQAVAERERAFRTTRLLADPLFEAAAGAVKDKLWQEFVNSGLSDDDARRNTRIGLEMLNRVLAELRRHMETGKLADAKLSEIEDRRKRLGIFKQMRGVA